MLDYKKEYERWENADLLDFDLRRELNLLSGKEEEIKEHEYFCGSTGNGRLGKIYPGGRTGEAGGHQL